jgi:hypothetical protein
MIVARSKLVWDFTLTIHGLHLLATSAYVRELPSNLLWWSLQICSGGLMMALGVWACQWRELQPMAFGGNDPKRAEAQEGTRQNNNRQREGNVSRAIRGLLQNIGMARPDAEGEYELVDTERRDDS